MKTDIAAEVNIPEGITLTVQDRTISVKGKAGEVSREFESPSITFTQDGSKLVIAAKKATQREKKLINTFKAHLNNMCKGAAESFEYKLKICSGHFPMTVAVSGSEIVVKNFIGEIVPRKLSIKQGADVKVDGEIITVKSPSKEIAGQVAADIEKMCKRPNFDNRIFQDGIYIISKANKEIA